MPHASPTLPLTCSLKPTRAGHGPFLHSTTRRSSRLAASVSRRGELEKRATRLLTGACARGMREDWTPPLAIVTGSLFRDVRREVQLPSSLPVRGSRCTRCFAYVVGAGGTSASPATSRSASTTELRTTQWVVVVQVSRPETRLTISGLFAHHASVRCRVDRR